MRPSRIFIQTGAAGSDTNISATCDALTLTEYQAGIAFDVSIAATTDALTLTEYGATVTWDYQISATTDALTLTEYNAEVIFGTEINATTEALTLTEYTASIAYAVEITTNTEALTLTEYPATVELNTAIESKGGFVPPVYRKDKIKRKNEDILEKVRALVDKVEELPLPVEIEERVEKVKVRAEKAVIIKPSDTRTKEIKNTAAQIERLEEVIEKQIKLIAQDENDAINALLQII